MATGLDYSRDRLVLIERPCPTCGADAIQEGRPVAQGVDYEYESCSNLFTFVRCDICDTVYLSPSPSLEDFEVIYPESYYTTTERSEGGGAGAVVRQIWDRVERQRASELRDTLGDGNRHILDIGCGDGRLLRILRRHGRSDWQLDGVEKSLPDEAIVGASRQGITIHQGLYEELDLGKETFDLIVAQQVIEHTLDPGAVLDKAFEELRIGGHMILDTPNFEGLDRALFPSSYWGGYHFPRHMTLFTPDTISELGRRHGFEVLDLKALLSPVFWIMTLHNIGVGSGLPRWLTSKLTYRSLPLLALATLIEVPNMTILKRTSNMRVKLRKREARGL